MALHHELTGPRAVHPFAFVQATDPALDPDNHVAAFKPWIDTGSGNAFKIRNSDNDAWITVAAGAAQVTATFRLVPVLISTVVEELPQPMAIGAFSLVNYV